jgi:adenosyl cobinamide kinase/adenosyl cobinamide phosphate guanylyltransferase
VITLVLGGARSGKSAVAESLAARHGGPVTYLASGTATDDDMAARIAAHQRRRPAGWRTVEAADDVPGVLRTTDGTILLDALGTWLAGQRDFEADVDGLCDALVSRRDPTVVVSDEVGMGVHPSTELGRRFRDALGTVNRRVAAVADEALLVVAGRVLRLDEAP